MDHSSRTHSHKTKGSRTFHALICSTLMYQILDVFFHFTVNFSINKSKLRFALCCPVLSSCSISYMHSLINKRMHDMELYNIHPVFRLKKAETVWLGLYAYIRMLRKKQSRHKELLALLKSRILMYDGVDYNSPHLNYAVDDSHSSVFWKLKF